MSIVENLCNIKSGIDRILSIDHEVIVRPANDIKLTTDKRLHDYICESIASFSDLPIVSEESPLNFKEIDLTRSYWIIDPLDGSFNFHRKIPYYCISICLMEGNVPTKGWIYDPINDAIFWTDNDKNSYKNSSRITCSAEVQKSAGVLLTGFPSGMKKEEVLNEASSVYQNFSKVRMIGSASLSLCMVASGKAEAYYEHGIYLWDVAAGITLVRNAGGFVKMEKIAGMKYDVYASNGSINE